MVRAVVVVVGPGMRVVRMLHCGTVLASQRQIALSRSVVVSKEVNNRITHIIHNIQFIRKHEMRGSGSEDFQ